MGKIGRNDPCPCGSGKKYKRCCLDRSEIFANVNTRQNNNSTDSLCIYAQQISRESLIASLSGMLVMPENMQQVVSLEQAIHVILSSPRTKATKTSTPVTTNELRSALEKSEVFAAWHHQEDPPEGLFTENIPFIGGNFIVYPGINAKSGFHLRHLLRASFLPGHCEGLPDEFKALAGASAQALLLVSDEVANRLGHRRWMPGLDPGAVSTSITIPSDEILAQLLRAVTFTKKDLESILSRFDLPFDCLLPFIVTTDESQHFTCLADDEHILHAKPLLKCDETFVLAHPTSIPTALRHFLICAATRFGCHHTLADLYHRESLLCVNQSLHLLHFDRQEVALPPWPSKPTCTTEYTCRIDDRIVSYGLVCTDSLKDYDGDKPFGMWKSPTLTAVIESRIKEIVPFLKSTMAARANTVFAVVLYGNVGRYGTYSLNPHLADATVLMDIEELEVIARDKESDALRLWKFASAYDSFTIKNKVFSWSALDSFALFREHADSFYLDDGTNSKFVNIDYDWGRSYRIRSIGLWDPHLIPHWRSSGLIDVVNRHDNEIPIVLPSERIGVTCEQAVTCYASPIWVAPSHQTLRKLDLLFTDGLSYWLWQLSSVTKQFFDQILRDRPWAVLFKYDDMSAWVNMDVPPEEDEAEFIDVPIETDASTRQIIITLSSALRSILNRADNAGERILVDAILRAVNSLLKSNDSGLQLDDAARYQILDQCVPLGQKKMIMLINSNINPQLRSDGLPAVRLIQDYDLSQQDDDLATDVNRKLSPTLPVGEVSKERNKDLVEGILERYVSKLDEKVCHFNGIALLKKLIAQNEALINDLAMSRLTIPTYAACFKNTPQQDQFISERLHKIDRTALATRFLIEYVTAHLPNGKLSPSCSDFDEFLGISCGLIDWGFIGDEIRCGVFFHELSILKSGHVGIVSGGRAEAFSSFLFARTLESLETLQDLFSDQWPQKVAAPSSALQKPLGIDEGEIAFRAEFGFTPQEFTGICNALINIGFELGGGAVSKFEDELIEGIASLLNISSECVSRVFDELALDPRTTWATPPQGYEKDDILPFRYNRRLSFIRRPLVRLPDDVTPVRRRIYWGPLHVDQAAYNLVALILLGRYKQKHCKSKEMISYLGKVSDELGSAFEKEAADWAKSHLSFTVRRNLQIAPGEFFDSQKDLGDIDVLLIDPASHRLFCIECKDVHVSRNAVEMSGEISRLIRGDPKKPDELSRVIMHGKRIEWLRTNWHQVVEKLKLDTQQWAIIPLMLTSREIAAPYIVGSPIPFLSMSRLRRQPLETLDQLSRGEHVVNVA